jgi:septal ring factor EnvC (AmiA/AmiB activator)
VIRVLANWMPVRRRFVQTAALGLVLAACVGLAYLAWSNYDRADRWKARSTRLERNAEALNTLLIQRSNSLNARTRELNGMAGKVRRATRTLRRSEQDVASLSRRQRELANEKAHVEDERTETRRRADNQPRSRQRRRLECDRNAP